MNLSKVSLLKGIKKITELKTEEKIVFLRLDLNVPIESGRVQDDTRIRESLPTLNYLVQHKAKVIVASHLGRPKSPEDKEFSLEPVAQRLAELTNLEVILTQDATLDFMKPTLAGLTRGKIVMLENLRFEEGETKNSEDLARQWAQWTEVYINDAFGACHRAHASIDALPRMIRSRGCGFLIEKELSCLGRLISKPPTPYYLILGGAKVSDKIGVIENLIDSVDGFLIGGAMAYTFLAAQGVPVGQSRVEKEQLNYTRQLLDRIKIREKKLYLPIDHRIAKDSGAHEVEKVTETASIPEGFVGLDIGPKTEKLFAEVINQAKTVFWNGPLGFFEKPAFSEGTRSIALALAQNKQAFRVVGGGDTARAAQEMGIQNQVDHVSTGGGASLEFLQGDQLPGIEALRIRQGQT